MNVTVNRGTSGTKLTLHYACRAKTRITIECVLHILFIGCWLTVKDLGPRPTLGDYMYRNTSVLQPVAR